MDTSKLNAAYRCDETSTSCHGQIGFSVEAHSRGSSIVNVHEITVLTFKRMANGNPGNPTPESKME